MNITLTHLLSSQHLNSSRISLYIYDSPVPAEKPLLSLRPLFSVLHIPNLYLGASPEQTFQYILAQIYLLH